MGITANGSVFANPTSQSETRVPSLAPETLEPGTVFALTADAHENADFLEILSDSEIVGGTYAYERLTDTTAV